MYHCLIHLRALPQTQKEAQEAFGKSPRNTSHQQPSSPLSTLLPESATSTEAAATATSLLPTEHEIHSQPFELLRKLLRFTQLLCENHHEPNQKLLHQQDWSGNRRSVDIVTATVHFFEKVRSCITPTTIEVAIQSLNTTTEYIQGPCKTNQNAVVQAKFLDTAAALLKQSPDHYKRKVTNAACLCNL